MQCKAVQLSLSVFFFVDVVCVACKLHGDLCAIIALLLVYRNSHTRVFVRHHWPVTCVVCLSASLSVNAMDHACAKLLRYYTFFLCHPTERKKNNPFLSSIDSIIQSIVPP